MKKATIVNVEQSLEGTKVTYSTGTVRMFYGKCPETVYTWIRVNVTGPKKDAEWRARRRQYAMDEANPTKIRKVERTADGRYKVTYYTGKSRTFREETLPNTARIYMEFEKNFVA